MQAQSRALACIPAWQAVPEDIRTAVPRWLPLVLLGVILVGGIVGRLIDQPKTRVQ